MSYSNKKIQLILKIFIVIVVSLLVIFIIFEPKEKVSNNNIINNDKQLLIGAFNVQVFGESKMSKPNVVASLVEILSRYDIVLIEEIRDKKGEAIVKLLHYLNTASGNKYSFVISNRLGNSSSKEQYAFIYNKNKIKVLDAYNFTDIGNKFEREPYSVKFKYFNYDFILVGIHIDPDIVYRELSELSSSLDYISRYLSDDDLILMGDLNADCHYISDLQLKKILLYNEYNWWIDSSLDTTVSKTDCAYDRIISSKRLKYSITNAQVYRFDIIQQIKYKQAKRVSDHYPIEFLLSF